MAGGEAIEFSVKLSPDDYAAGAALMVRRALLRRAPVWIGIGIAALLAFDYLSYGNAMFASANNIGAVLGGVAIFVAIPLVGIALFLWLVLPHIARKQFAQTTSAGAETVYRLDEHGLKASNRYGTDDLPWDMLHRALADRKVLLIDKGAESAFTIPLDQVDPPTREAIFGLLERRDLWKGARP